MKIVVSTSERPDRTNLLTYGPDLIEIRLDLIPEDLPATVQEWYAGTEIPLILTLRSQQEGGAFTGSEEDWFNIIQPLLPYASYIDIEQRFSSKAPYIRDQGIGIIASYHMKRMPSVQELAAIDDVLRAYGDIPKIVVTPSDEHDIIMLLSYTVHAEKPLVTSIMGDKFRHMRPVLPLFGSGWIFTHGGEATAAGQYHIRDIREIYTRLVGGSEWEPGN